MSNPKRWIWLVGAWLIATVAAAAVALAVVGVAGDQVADEAVRPLSAEEVEALGVATPAIPSTTAATGPASTTGDPGSSGDTTTTAVAPPSTEGTAPSTTQAPAATTTVPAATTTSSPAAATTTTAAPEEPQIDSRQITGGSVVVRWTSSSVELVSASPADGFSLDVEKRGPEKVELKFESESVVTEYTAEVSDGELVVQTQVDSDDD